MKINWKFVSMGVVAAFWLLLTVTAWLSPPEEASQTERRELAQFPEVTGDRILSGRFAEEFEDYTLDQFPLRDTFRQIKARFHRDVWKQKDNNGIYMAQGSAAKLEYPMNEASVNNALKVFNRIREKYLQDSKVYLAVVPDKSYYLASEGGQPTMDYEALFEKMRQGMLWADYVNLTDVLSGEDYYRTDTHWRQERLLKAAGRLCDAMNIPAPKEGDYTAQAASRPFYGVYFGQAALPMEPDTLVTMHSDLLSACRVKNHETGRYGDVYDASKLTGKDMYEVFLSGSVSLLTIENPQAETDRELIIFRDSFGSAIAPLLVQGYKTVTLVDVRYLSSTMLGRFLDFHGQDVLFLYSTTVLNNSNQMM